MRFDAIGVLVDAKGTVGEVVHVEGVTISSPR